jgi:hypothetical protein
VLSSAAGKETTMARKQDVKVESGKRVKDLGLKSVDDARARNVRGGDDIVFDKKTDKGSAK